MFEAGMDMMKPRPQSYKRFFILTAVFIIFAALTVVVFFLLQSRAVDSYFSAGNKSYDAAFSALDDGLDELAAESSEGDAKAVSASARKTLKKIPKAKKHLKDAEKSFARMERAAYSSWEGLAAYHARQSVDHAEKGAKDLEDLLLGLSSMSKSIKDVGKASELFSEAFKKSNEAVAASNNDGYDQAVVKAESAEKLFEESQALLVKADRSWQGSALGELAKSLGVARDWAAKTREMAEAGKADKLDDYNKLVIENNKLSRLITDLAGKPALADPANWSRRKFETLGDKVEASFNRADKRREKALNIWLKHS